MRALGLARLAGGARGHRVVPVGRVQHLAEGGAVVLREVAAARHVHGVAVARPRHGPQVEERLCPPRPPPAGGQTSPGADRPTSRSAGSSPIRSARSWTAARNAPATSRSRSGARLGAGRRPAPGPRPSARGPGRRPLRAAGPGPRSRRPDGCGRPRTPPLPRSRGSSAGPRRTGPAGARDQQPLFPRGSRSEGDALDVGARGHARAGP